MKKLLLLLLLIPVLLKAQYTTGLPSGYLPFGSVYFKIDAITHDTTFIAGATGKGYHVLVANQALKDSLANHTASISGFTISSIPSIGQVVTTGTADNVIRQLYAQSQVPTATLTGGQTLELHSAGTFSATLNWGASRQAATVPLSTIVVAGTTQTFSQPAAPGTVSGTQSVTVTYNTNVTYTNTVTTTDSKTGNATTSFTFLPKFYYGRASGTSPTTTEILAASGGSSALSSGHTGTYTISASGSNYPFFAYPSSQGTVTSILDVNGFNVTSSFNTSTISLTNASGYTQTYRYYILNSATSANYQITIN